MTSETTDDERPSTDIQASLKELADGDKAMIYEVGSVTTHVKADISHDHHEDGVVTGYEIITEVPTTDGTIVTQTGECDGLKLTKALLTVDTIRVVPIEQTHFHEGEN